MLVLVPRHNIVADADTATDGSFYTTGPDYTADPATEPCSSCKQGVSFELYMPIKDTLYNCDPEDFPSLLLGPPRCQNGFCGKIDEIQGSRHIIVYIPDVYKDGDEIGVMVATDGNTYMDDIKNSMDNLIGAEDKDRSLPPFVLVMISGIGLECDMRTTEYATFSDTYARFAADEVLPFVTNHPEIKAKFPNLKITDDPAGRAGFGCSDGGSAAFKMSFLSPNLFGIAVAYSASLVHYPSIISADRPFGMAELWVPQPEGQELIATTQKKSIRIFHNVNDKDYGTEGSCLGTSTPVLNGNFTGEFIPVSLNDLGLSGEYNNWVEANNQTAAALTAKGYNTRYAYGLNACHCDSAQMSQDMPNTLVWAWQEWKEKIAEDIPAPISLTESPTVPPSSSAATNLVHNGVQAFTTGMAVIYIADLLLK